MSELLVRHQECATAEQLHEDHQRCQRHEPFPEVRRLAVRVRDDPSSRFALRHPGLLFDDRRSRRRSPIWSSRVAVWKAWRDLIVYSGYYQVSRFARTQKLSAASPSEPAHGVQGSCLGAYEALALTRRRRHYPGRWRPTSRSSTGSIARTSSSSKS